MQQAKQPNGRSIWASHAFSDRAGGLALLLHAIQRPGRSRPRRTRTRVAFCGLHRTRRRDVGARERRRGERPGLSQRCCGALPAMLWRHWKQLPTCHARAPRLLTRRPHRLCEHSQVAPPPRDSRARCRWAAQRAPALSRARLARGPASLTSLCASEPPAQRSCTPPAPYQLCRRSGAAPLSQRLKSPLHLAPPLCSAMRSALICAPPPPTNTARGWGRSSARVNAVPLPPLRIKSSAASVPLVSRSQQCASAA